MAKIKKITAREVLDSRGIPTIEANLELDTGQHVQAIASSGQSKGKYECKELRDGDIARYNGFGVLKAVSYINNLIAEKIEGIEINRHIEIDQWLAEADGTEDFSKLGVNAVLTVSQLMLKAGAISNQLPIYEYVNQLFNTLFKKSVPLQRLPSPIFSVLNGGKHGAKNLDFQEFHVVPASSMSFSNSLEIVVSLYDNMREIFKRRNMPISVSEEGGFTPTLYSNEEGFVIIKEALHSKGLKLGVDIFTGLDCATDTYYKSGKYFLKDAGSGLKVDQYIKLLRSLVDKYNILILEDPINEEDHKTWRSLTEIIGKQTFVVGDDYTSGNIDRLKKVIEGKGCNAVLIKFNQTGTIYQLMQLADLIRFSDLKLVFSHRLGESTDSIIADIAVGLQADFVKFGAPSGGERVVKYNRLLHIEALLQGKT